ncbi:MAG: autotransporter domain-containing protein [Proteobacteria bacterium]|nr:autotransporter domain-containing protein [Pseudomonadota bacterium]
MGFHPLLATPFAFLPAYKAGHPAWLRELNVNGVVKMSRLEDDEEDGEFILDGGIVSGTGIIDAPYGFYHTGGTIKPGNSIGTLTINGDYTQGSAGKLLIEVASTTSNDLLAINGAADINGILQTSWTGGYTPAIRTKFGTILTASSGITGQFTSLLTNITPTVLFKPKYDIPNQIYLMVERDYINQSLLPYLTMNQRAVGSMLNSVGNTAAGDLDTVLTAIDSLPAYGQTAYALDQLAPKGSDAQSGMGISGASFQTGNLSERLSDLRHGIRGMSLNGLYFKNGNGKPIMLADINPDLTGMLPSGVDERWGFFVKGNAVYGDQKDTPDATGYNFTSMGVTMGSDYRFTGSFIAGLMLGLNTSRANVDSMGSKVKMDGYTLGAYGTYYKKNFYMDGSISYGFANYDNTRRIVFPGLDRTATSSLDGNQLTAYGGTGYDIRKNNWIITPNVSFQYVKLGIDSYTEGGAGAINLDVDKQNTESLQGNIGARVSYTWQTDKAVIMPNIRASYGYEFSRDSQNVTSRLAQGSSPFSIQTMSPDRNFFSFGAGITAFTVRDMSVYINYDAQIGENKYVAQSVNAGLRVGF